MKSESHNYSRILLMQKDAICNITFSGVPISKNTYLNVCAQFLEDLIDLIFEPSTQHLISFIQNKHLDPFWGCAEIQC